MPALSAKLWRSGCGRPVPPPTRGLGFARHRIGCACPPASKREYLWLVGSFPTPCYATTLAMSDAGSVGTGVSTLRGRLRIDGEIIATSSSTAELASTGLPTCT